MRRLACALLLLATAAPAAAQTDPSETQAEGLSVGLLFGPALDWSDPWFVTGLRFSAPVGRRVSLDLESAMIHGGESELGRIHGWWGAQLRFLTSPQASASRYWIAGLGVMPGDKLLPDRSIRERRSYSVLVLGIGQRQLLSRGLRLSTELSFHGGDGLGAWATVGAQWGRHRR